MRPRLQRLFPIGIGFTIIMLYYYSREGSDLISNQKEDQKNTFSLTLEATQKNKGLGNRLFEIVALIGIADLTKRVPVVNLNRNFGSLKRLSEIQATFPKLIDKPRYSFIPMSAVKSIKFHQKGCCRYDIGELLDRNDTHLLGDGIYLQSHLYFSHIRDEMIDLFEPSLKAQEEANQQLKDLRLGEPILCVHARRRDFISYSVPMASRSDFTRLATEHLMRKNRPKTVLLFSDDPAWMRKTFKGLLEDKNQMINLTNDAKEGNIYLTDLKSPFTILTIAWQRCDIMLDTAPHSSFAWFMGFLAKRGRGVVYFSEHFAKRKGGLDKHLIPREYFLPDWTPLRMHVNKSFEEIRIDQIDPFPPD